MERFIPWEAIRTKALQNPDVKRRYDALEEEYAQLEAALPATDKG